MNAVVPATWRSTADELRQRVSSIFDRWMPSRAEQVPTSAHEYWPSYFASATVPTVDLKETDEEVVVTAELPGLDEKDFNVELEGRRLVLRGEKRVSREDRNRTYYHTECSYGSFYRSVPLPCEVDTNKTRATYRRGVLKVRMPKTEEAKANTVRVTIN